MQIVSLIGAIVACVFMIWSIYKGLNLPLACIITTIVIALTSGLSIDAAWDAGMENGVLQMAQSTIGVYIFGSLLGMMYSESGAALALSNALFRPLRNMKNPTPRLILSLAVFLVIRMLLGLTGIDPMAVMVMMVAILMAMFRDLNIPRKYANCLLVCATTVGACLPFVPSVSNLFLPMLIPGFTASSLWGVRLLWTVLFLVLSTLWIARMIRRDQNNGEGFDRGNMDEYRVDDEGDTPRPNALLALIPLIVVLLTYNLAHLSGWLSTACGFAVGALLFYRYLPLGKEQGFKAKFSCFVEKCNRSSIMIPLYMCLYVMPGAVLTITPAYELLLQFASFLSMHLPLALGFGLIAVVMVLLGNSATVIMANVAATVFIPAGLAAPVAGTLLVMALTVFDSLPNSPGLNMQAQLTDTPMSKGYPSIFKTTVVLTFVIMMFFAVLFSLGIGF